MNKIYLNYRPQVPKYKILRFKPKKNEYCLCIPVINEGYRLKSLLKKIKKYKTIDVMILDKGSTDGSTDAGYLKKAGVNFLLTLEEPGFLSSQLRMGYYQAILTGYKGVITIDGNDKDDPKSIPLFINHLNKSFDYLQGSRFIKGGKAINTPALRYYAIKFIHAPLLSIASGFRYTDTTSGFRGYSKKLLIDDRMKIFRKKFVAYELLAYVSYRAPGLGFKTKEVPITRKYPNKGHMPTKIKGVFGNLDLLKTLLIVISGKFNPTY